MTGDLLAVILSPVTHKITSISSFRLHREALKQSATDPKTGLIDVNILATGLSVSDRKRRQEIAKALKTMLQSKGQAPNMNAQRLFEDFREHSDAVRHSKSK